MPRRRSKPQEPEIPAVEELEEEELELGEPLNAIQLGSAAERLLADPAFSHAMDKAYSGCFTEWQEAETVEKREAAHAHMVALRLVENELGILVNSGILEAARSRPTVY